MSVGWWLFVLLLSWQGFQIYSLWHPAGQCPSGAEEGRCWGPHYPEGAGGFRLELYRQRCHALRGHERAPQRFLASLSAADMFFSRGDLELSSASHAAFSVPELVVPLYPDTRANGSLCVVAVLTPSESLGGPPLITTAELTTTRMPTHRPRTFLLSPDSDDSTPAPSTFSSSTPPSSSLLQPIPHLKTVMTLRLLVDHLIYDPRYPNGFDFPLHLLPNPGSGNNQGFKSQYLPLLYFDELHLTRRQMLPLSPNTSRPDPSMELHFRPVDLGRYRLLAQLKEAVEAMGRLGLAEDDLDEVLLLLNPDHLYRLGVTFVISLLHSVFAFLAFRNEIGFWKGRETIEGLSKRAVVGNAMCSLVLFLFLYDNDTSYLILATSCVSLCIELWKVTKVLDIFHPAPRTRAENDTEAIDAAGMRYLSYLLLPCVVAWAAYSLLYQPHRGYYSWFIASCANAVYAFGFVLMTPQIFINYRLKTTAFLPWRAMCYKFFNTFVDDVLAFYLLDMPTIHRFATLRDDLVFFIYLYQRWIYPVDPSRPNEFGYVYHQEKEDLNPRQVEG